MAGSCELGSAAAGKFSTGCTTSHLRLFQIVHGQIRCDSPSPGSEFAIRVIASMGPVDLPEGFDRQVFRRRRIANDPHDPTENLSLKLAEQHFEGFDFSRSKLLEDRRMLAQSIPFPSLYTLTGRTVAEGFVFFPRTSFKKRLFVAADNVRLQSELHVLGSTPGSLSESAQCGRCLGRGRKCGN